MRTIKPGFFENDELAALPFQARLLFAGLWCFCDREGRCEDRPKRIKAAVFPYDALDVSRLLDALVTAGFIQRYVVGRQRLIQVLQFAQHQRPHKNEQKSALPGPIVLGMDKAVPEHNQGSAMDAQETVVGTVVGTGHPESPPAAGVVVEIPEKPQQHPEALPVCQYLERAIAHWKPDAIAATRKTVESPSSVKDMDRLFRLDGRSPDRAREIIDWLFLGETWTYAPTNGFDWRPNVQSGGALRKHWDRLDNQCRIALIDEKDRS